MSTLDAARRYILCACSRNETVGVGFHKSLEPFNMDIGLGRNFWLKSKCDLFAAVIEPMRPSDKLIDKEAQYAQQTQGILYLPNR